MIRLRWRGWRRDLVAGLIGSVVSVGVLIPVGWWRVTVEQQRAEAAEQRAVAIEQKVKEDEAQSQATRERLLQETLIAVQAQLGLCYALAR